VVGFALHRQHGLDFVAQAGLHVGPAEVARVGQQGRDAPQGLRQGLNLIQYRRNFALVVGRLRDVCGDHQHRRGVDRSLRVVALPEATPRAGHDAGLFVGEVDLVAWPGFTRWRLGLGAARLLARLALGLALGALGLVRLVLHGMALGSPLSDLVLGLRQCSQTLLAPGDLRRHVQAVAHRPAVAVLGQLQQQLHLFAQLGFDPVGVLPRQRTVLAGVGRNLGAVQCDGAQLQALHLARQHQHLHEQRFDLRQKAPPERGNAVVVGLGVGSDEAHGHRVVAGALDLAAGVQPGGVAVDQQAQQHRRMVGIAAATRVLTRQFAQIQLVDDLHHEARQMILGKPLVHRRRQQIGSVSINGNEAAHGLGGSLNVAAIVSAATPSG
jgi:hypothetical protein